MSRLVYLVRMTGDFSDAFPVRGGAMRQKRAIEELAGLTPRRTVGHALNTRRLP